MINLPVYKPCLSVITLLGVMLPIAHAPAIGLPSRPADPPLLPQLAQTTPQAIPPQSFWQRRPKRPLTIRGVIWRRSRQG
ncbi:MAG: hypothetical protein HC866_11920 [Leptolyngbyaceae cyanobacterium RU_5_1]|nr:hypothetical protein [Leptolyngbyaceae cyanobacterium RU_5_1]